MKVFNDYRGIVINNLCEYHPYAMSILSTDTSANKSFVSVIATTTLFNIIFDCCNRFLSLLFTNLIMQK